MPFIESMMSVLVRVACSNSPSTGVQPKQLNSIAQTKKQSELTA